jgi:hypothetical protein
MVKVVYTKVINPSKKLDIDDFFKAKLRIPNPSFDVVDSSFQQKDGI